MSSELQIDLGAVAANVRRLAASTPGTLLAVVKADGFGHGTVDVARTTLLHGATWLGVTSLAEAQAVREAGLSAPILSWLNPVRSPWEWAIRARVDVAVPSLDHWDAILRATRRVGAPARVHLHADCGIARDGAAPQEWERLCAQASLAQQAGRVRIVGLMGHLSWADDPEHPQNERERAGFARAVAVATSLGIEAPHRHLAATAATLHDPAARHTLSRVGAGLVGIDPAGRAALAQPLTLLSELVAVRQVTAGTGVGYGHTWRAERDTTLGLVPVGYADGIPRASSNRAEMLVGDRRCRVVGRVSMDQTVVDVGPGGAAPGARVAVFGPGSGGEPTVAEWARWCDTIPHEIVTGIGARVRRVVVPAPLRNAS